MRGSAQSVTLAGVDAHPVQVEVNTGEAGELKFILIARLDAVVDSKHRSLDRPARAQPPRGSCLRK